jgi:hypothetical protein
MRRLALVDYRGGTYLVSTLTPVAPTVFMQLAPDEADEKEEDDAEAGGDTDEWQRKAMFWGELVLELVFGLFSLMGLRVKHGVRLGRWLDRLLSLIARRPKIRRLLRGLASSAQPVSAWNLLELLMLLAEEVDRDCIVEFIGEVFDVSFWGIVWFLSKFGARLIPGAGQALMLADLGLLVGEVVTKIVGRALQPAATAQGN